MATATDLDRLGIDRWHPFRADCEALLEHCTHRRYAEAAEHLLRLASQYRDRWGRNREAWDSLAAGLDALIEEKRGPLGVRMFRDSCARVARSRRLSQAEKRLERLPLVS